MLGVVVLTKGVVGTRPVDGGRATLHEEGHADGLGRLLLGGASPRRSPGVAGDTAIALGADGQRQRDEFLGLGRQGTLGHGSGVQLLEAGVDVGNRLPEVSGEGSEGLLNGFAVLMCHEKYDTPQGIDVS